MVIVFRWCLKSKGVRNGILIVSPEHTHTHISAKLNFIVTNNGAEYEACILGLEAAVAIEIRKLKVYWDSSLIIK